jgi:hypothetical protein
MKKFIWTLFAALAFTSLAVGVAQAQALTPEQKVELANKMITEHNWEAAKKILASTDGVEVSLSSATPSAPIEKRVVANAREWSELGTNLGTALVATAKELGMAASEFANTPLGKVTVGVVTYKVIGKELVRTFLALLIFPFGVFIALKMYKVCAIVDIEYEQRTLFWGAVSFKTVKKIRYTDGEAVFGAVALTLVTSGLTIGAVAAMLP